MIFLVFTAVAMCAGLFLLLGLNPSHFIRAVFTRHRKDSFKTRLLAARNFKRQCFLEKQFAKTDQVLRITTDRARASAPASRWGQSCSLRRALKPTRFYCNISPSTTRSIPADTGRQENMPRNTVART